MKPMDEDRFWQLIDLAGGGPDGIDALRSGLEALPRKDVIRFKERLARVLYDLDRRTLADQPVFFEGEEDEEDEDGPIPLSDDSFLYLRCGIVLRGRDTVAAVVADPALLATGRWPDGEDLLYLADEVAGKDIDTTYDYETGSNERHWPERPEPDREPWDTGPRPVVVECLDHTRPVEAARVLHDGTEVPELLYAVPRFLDFELVSALTVDLSRAVVLAGGLPAALGVTRVAVTIGLGEDWRTAPVVGAPREDDEFGVSDPPEMLLPVTAQMPLATLRAWPPQTRRTALTALAAACVLAALPVGHRSRPALEAIHREGAALLG